MSAAARRAPGPKVKKLSLTPRRLPGSGGTAFLKVSVTGNGVNYVRAQARVAGGSGGSIITLTGSGRTYQGSVPVPGNLRSTTATASILVFVTSGPDGTITEATVGSIRLDPYDSSQPPPPPPLD